MVFSLNIRQYVLAYFLDNCNCQCKMCQLVKLGIIRNGTMNDVEMIVSVTSLNSALICKMESLAIT